MAKVKDKENSKAARDRVIYKGTPIRLSADFSAETLQVRRKWHDIFKVLKGKNLQLMILYPARLSFRIEREKNNFSEEQKLKELINTKPTVKEMVRGLL